MILVTGASGKTGKAVLRALTSRGISVRTLVRSESQAVEMRKIGARDVMIGDLRDKESIFQSVQKIDRLYFICPNVAPDEVEIGENLLHLARQNGVQRFVYHSVLHPQIEAMPHHWQKMRMEEAIFTSGMDFTILQPCAYMQNILASWQSIIEKGIYPVPYSTSARLNIVDLENVAEVAANLLSGMNHKNSVFELAGPQSLSQEDVAKILTSVLNRDVKAQETDRLEWASNARNSGLGKYETATLLKMFNYYHQFGLQGNSVILEFLLGRPATTFEQFVRGQLNDRISPIPGGQQ